MKTKGWLKELTFLVFWNLFDFKNKRNKTLHILTFRNKTKKRFFKIEPDFVII
jgi:hypothetical protein